MNDWIEDFRQTIDKATGSLLAISEQQSELARATDKWSPKEIVGHLIDSAINNHQRFVRAQFSDELVFPGYQQDEWVRVQRYQERSWTELVELWRLLNLHLAQVMSVTPAAVATKPRARHNLHQLAWQRVAEDESTTLEYFMQDYVGHLHHHLDQILKPGSD
jgi:hypothetical protein